MHMGHEASRDPVPREKRAEVVLSVICVLSRAAAHPAPYQRTVLDILSSEGLVKLPLQN